jgi:hypothetical protein
MHTLLKKDRHYEWTCPADNAQCIEKGKKLVSELLTGRVSKRSVVTPRCSNLILFICGRLDLVVSVTWRQKSGPKRAEKVILQFTRMIQATR